MEEHHEISFSIFGSVVGLNGVELLSRLIIIVNFFLISLDLLWVL